MTRSAHAPEDLRRQSAQEVGHARDVVAGGVEDDQVTSATSSSGPRRTASRSWVRGPSAAAVHVAEQTLCAGLGRRAEPVADVDREHQASVGGLRRGQARQHLPQPGRVHVPTVQRVVRCAGPTPVLSHPGSGPPLPHRTVRAQQRVREVEQFVQLTLTACAVATCALGEHMIRRRPPQRPANTQLGHPVRDIVREPVCEKAQSGQCHSEIHLDELSGKAQLGDAQERAGRGERRTQGRVGEPVPRSSENIPLVAPHVDH
jgi:hypothetical protein